MESSGVSGVVVFFCLLACSQTYSLETDKIFVQALTPQKIRFFTIKPRNIFSVKFKANINKKIEIGDVGMISGAVVNIDHGEWIYEDPNMKLNIGDNINYYIHGNIIRISFFENNSTYTIKEFIMRSNDSVPDVKMQALKPQGMRVSILLDDGLSDASEKYLEEIFDPPLFEVQSEQRLVEPLGIPGYGFSRLFISGVIPEGRPNHVGPVSIINYIEFQGNINKIISISDKGMISAKVSKPINDRLLYENLNMKLIVGDVVYYYIYGRYNGVAYFYKYKFTYTAEAFESPLSDSLADSLPNVTIHSLKPKGIRLSIPADPKNTDLEFQGFLKLKNKSVPSGTISAKVIGPLNGNWLYEDTKLNVGDTVQYNVKGVYEGVYYFKIYSTYTVKAFESTSSDPNTDCLPTSTLLKNGQACAGQILFEDNFDLLREDLWQIEQYIPDEPDYPFVSYQRPPNAPTVLVKGGYLYIEPILQQELSGFSDLSIYTKSLDLFNGCTATTTKCFAEAWGASILPPIVSGRLTSKSFSFTYGVIEVRAKLPQGDWLYPDILLEPLMKKYGVSNYASGVLRIAGARGNSDLLAFNNEVGDKLLYGGPILNTRCRNTLVSEKFSNKSWGDDFHVFGARWEPDRITLSVDDEEWARIEPKASGLQGHFSHTCDLPRPFLSRGSNMAPFDDHFFITLGLAAGGITEFNDNLTSDVRRPKPWRNSGRKACLRFWQDMTSWYTTWMQPALIVDYVKVRAL